MKRYHVSKQLYDKSNTSNDILGYIDSTGKIIENAINLCVVMEVEPNQKYTISADLYATNGSRVAEFTAKPSIGSSGTVLGTINSTDKYRFTITTSSTTRYIAFHKGANGTEARQAFRAAIMINLGQTALPYEPYGNEWQTKSPPNYGTGTDVVTSLPVKVYGDGETNISLLLKGNTETSGNPSPQNPVTVDGVGEETANLLFKKIISAGLNPSGKITVQTGIYNVYVAKVTEGDIVTVSNFAEAYAFYDSEPFIDSTSIDNTRYITYDTPYTITIPNGAEYIAVRAYAEQDNTMLNTGSTPLPYEPYGYKISILKDLQALTPIYLSQPLRKSLDGTAFDTLDSTGLVTYNVDEYGQPQTATTETVTVPTITTTGGTVTLDVDTTIKPSEIDLTYHGWHEHEPLKRENGSWS